MPSQPKQPAWLKQKGYLSNVPTDQPTVQVRLEDFLDCMLLDDSLLSDSLANERSAKAKESAYLDPTITRHVREPLRRAYTSRRGSAGSRAAPPRAAS